MRCPNFFNSISNSLSPRIRLEGKDLESYDFLKALVKNSEVSGDESVLAPFTKKDPTDMIWDLRKRFISTVGTALFAYIHDHGALFSFAEGRKYAQANASVSTCEQALQIIKTILDGADPENVALSSRLYKLVSQFNTNVIAPYEKTNGVLVETKLYSVLAEQLLPQYKFENIENNRNVVAH